MQKRTLAKWIRGLRGAVAVALFGRRVLQALATTYITRKLSESPNLEGSLGDIELNLVKGLAVLRDISVAKLSEGRRVVEGRCREISVEMSLRQLLRGTLVGRVRLRDPHIQFFSDLASDPHDHGKPPADVLLALSRETQRFMPFHLRSLEVTEGSIEYISQSTSPPFRLTVDGVHLSATNVTNIPAPDDAAPSAHIFAEGRTTGNGRFWLRLNLPSLVHALTFELQAGVTRMNLVDWNDFLRAVAKFDVKRGICSIYSAFRVEGGRYQGYVQPHLQDLDVFAWQKEHGKGFLQICRQTVIAFLASLFKNKPRDELALNIPISGTFDDADVDTWSAVGSLLRNAFVHSLLPGRQDAKTSQANLEPEGWRPPFWKRKPAPC